MENLEPVSNIETETIEPTEVENQVVEEVTEPEVSATEEVSEEESTISEESAEDKEARKQRKIEQRFAELTKDKYELKKKIEKLEAEREKKEFTEDDFGDDKEAWNDYKLEQKVNEKLEAEREAYRKQSLEAEVLQEKAKTWQNKIDSFADELPDYAKVLKENPLEFLKQSDVDVILESPVGPKIAYVLASNPNLAEQYSSYSNQRSRDIFLAKLEMQIEAMPKKSRAKPVSKAPKPTPKMNSGGSGGGVDPSSMSMEAYMKWRNGE